MDFFTDAPYRSELNVGILKLSEKGFLYKLKREWIFNNNTILCEDTPSGDQNSSQMDMQTLRGVFLVLQLGVGVALVIGIAEFCWYNRKLAVNDKVNFYNIIYRMNRLILTYHFYFQLSPKVVMRKDFKFFLHFWKQQKPLSIYKSPDSNSNSRGSLIPSQHSTSETTATEKRKKKVKRRKRSEKSAKA